MSKNVPINDQTEEVRSLTESFLKASANDYGFKIPEMRWHQDTVFAKLKSFCPEADASGLLNHWQRALPMSKLPFSSRSAVIEDAVKMTELGLLTAGENINDPGVSFQVGKTNKFGNFIDPAHMVELLKIGLTPHIKADDLQACLEPQGNS